MILAVQEWINKSSTGYGAAENNGACVAHASIVRAALRCEVVEGVSILSEPRGRQSTAARAEPIGIDLLREFGTERVRLRSAVDFIHDLQTGGCVAFTALPTLAGLTSLRSSHRCSFPTSTLLHAARWENLIPSYMYLALFAEPDDRLVVTSLAGEVAARAMLAEVSAMIARRSATSDWAATDPSLITRIPLGVDELSKDAMERNRYRSEAGLNEDDCLLLYLGRFSETAKADLEPLLVTFRRLQAAAEVRVKLVLAGDNSDEDYSNRVLRIGMDLGLGEDLTILNNIDAQMKRRLLSASDIFVSPVDTIQETFGLVILEAMSAGLPVIASDWSGYRDIVVDGQTGFLIPTYWSEKGYSMAGELGALRSWRENAHLVAQCTFIDTEALFQALSRLVRDTQLRRSLGERGRQRMKSQYGWNAVIRKFEASWKEQSRLSKASLGERSRDHGHKLFNYGSLFGHYASSPLGSRSLVHLNPNLPHILEPIHRRLLQISDTRQIDAICSVMTACESGPRTVEELTSPSDFTRLSALLWLLKKGYCHLGKPQRRSAIQHSCCSALEL